MQEYLDTLSVRQDGSGRYVWVEVDYDKPRKEGTIVGVRSMKIHAFVRCSTNQIATLEQIMYDSDGTVLDSFANPEALQHPDDPVPESVGDDVVRAVCTRYPL